MSHFYVGVLVKAEDLLKKEEVVERMLAPYDENRNMPPYEVTCGCVGTVARDRVRKQADEKFGTWDQMREKHDKEITPKLKGLKSAKVFDVRQKSWEKNFCDPRTQFEKDRLFQMVDKNDTVKDCEECKGTGKHMSQYNPHSKWDWYVIGGRWCNVFAPKTYKYDKDPDNYETCMVCGGTGKRNDALGKEAREKNPKYTCDGCSGKGKSLKFSLVEKWPTHKAVSDLSDKEIPFAIVTPDGAWHEKGEMGWWGMVSNEKDDWKDTAKQILGKFPDLFIVVVDCHI